MKTQEKNQNTEEAFGFLFKKMWLFAKGHRHLVVAFLSMSAIANIIILAQPLIFGKFLNEIQVNGLGEHNITRLVWILLSILAVDLGFWLFHGPSRVIENIAAFRTERKYRQFLLSKVLDFGLSWHAPKDSGETIDRVNKAKRGLYDFSRFASIVVSIFIKALGTAVILAFFNLYIGLIALALLFVALIVIFRFDLRLIPQYKQLNIFENKVSARIFDTLTNITTIKVLHIESPMLSSIGRILWAPFKLFKKNKILVEVKWFTGGIIFTLIVVLPLLFYILFMYKNNLAIQVGTISAMYLYLTNLIDVYYTFASNYEEMIVNKTKVLGVQDIEESFNTQVKVVKREIPNWKSIALKNVSFAYEDVTHKTSHIQDIDFTFLKGENIALIGESGSGKTTFLKVLHGMYPTADAKIQIDNKKPQKTNFADIELKTTLVPQEPEIFSSSIRENITLGLKYSDDDIFKISDLAEFTQVIHQLPNGLDSVINEKGVNLSGGQKQRLALARALLFANGKEIILLDESTSSVDSETEVKIYKSIFTQFADKTVLASIHKMNLLKYFDRIVIFADGVIIDNGTFDELYGRNKKFQKDWSEYITK